MPAAPESGIYDGDELRFVEIIEINEFQESKRGDRSRMPGAFTPLTLGAVLSACSIRNLILSGWNCGCPRGLPGHPGQMTPGHQGLPVGPSWGGLHCSLCWWRLRRGPRRLGQEAVSVPASCTLPAPGACPLPFRIPDATQPVRWTLFPPQSEAECDPSHCHAGVRTRCPGRGSSF